MIQIEKRSQRQRLQQLVNETGNGLEDSLIDIVLRFPCGLKLALGDAQGMVAAFNDMQKVRCFHFAANALQKIQWTKGIARALYKQDRCGQGAQDFIANFCPIAHRAERVPETNKTIHSFLERHMAADTSTHAFADQDCRFRPMSFPCFAQCFSVRSDQPRQRIGAFPAFSHVGIIENFDVTNLGQTIFPILHPGMRRRRASSRSE